MNNNGMDVQGVIRAAMLFASSEDYANRRENIKKMLSPVDFALAEFLGAVFKPLDKEVVKRLVCDFLINVKVPTTGASIVAH